MVDYYLVGQGIDDRPPDKDYPVRMRYYADIMKVELDSVVSERIHRRWYSVLVKGIQHAQLQRASDTQADTVFAQYLDLIQHLICKEEDTGTWVDTHMEMSRW